MNADVLRLEFASFALIAICFATLFVMWRRKLLREYRLPAVLLAAQGVEASVETAILFFRKALGLKLGTAYAALFFTNWASFAIEEILRIVIIYMVFRLAMAPLQGLQNLGKVIFRWVAGVSVAISIGIAISPRVASAGFGLTPAITRFAGQAQQGISVLTLCLLLFVCFATKPLGLTYRSHLFGITLGLGVLAMSDLVQAAWFATTGAHSLYSGIYLFGTVSICVAFGIWGTYFVLPEPKREMVLLPTTSPFFFWNRISEALGADPGHVVVAGFHPDMLAAAEIEMFSAPDRSAPEPIEERALPALRSAAQH